MCRRLLARPEVPDQHRHRIAGNRDVAAPAMIEAAACYPAAAAASLAARRRDAPIILSLHTGDRGGVEQTLNSFLHCCTDIARAGCFLLVDAGLGGRDRALLARRYPSLDLTDPAVVGGPRRGAGTHR